MRNALTTSAILAVLLASSSLSASPVQAEPGGPIVPVILTPAPEAETPKSAKPVRSWVVQKRLGVDFKPEIRRARAQPEAHKFKPPEIQILTLETREERALRHVSESVERTTQGKQELELVWPDPLYYAPRWR